MERGVTIDMDSSLKEEARRFAEQQDMLYGPVIAAKPRNKPATAPLPAPRPQKTLQLMPQDAALPAKEWMTASSLDVLNQLICNCQQCGLGQLRKKFVFGVGNPNAGLVVVGEAPGADEDASGEPFVGMAGQLLNKILAAVQFRREDVFICNVLKCRPPGNRTPETAEVEQCKPYLLKQLELIQPKFILALGLSAANTLLERKSKMSELRGSVHDFHGIRTVVTYHPAALLRNPNWKRATWEDVQNLRRMYDEL